MGPATTKRQKLRIAVVDPAAYSPPYDYYFLRRISEFAEVDFYTSMPRVNKIYVERLEALNVKLKIYNIANRKHTTGIFSYLKLWSDILKNKRRYDRIHFIWMAVPIIDLIGFWIVRSKLVFTLHNPTPHEYRGKRYLPFALAYRLSRRVIFVSEWSRKAFLNSYGRKGEKSLTLPHGAMPLQPLTDPRARGGGLTKPPMTSNRLVFWGAIRPYKGVDFFNSVLEDSRGKSYELEIYGRWAKNLKDLKETLEKKCYVRDEYVPLSLVESLFEQRPVFVLPYSAATQSGVFYNILFHRQLFVASDVGDIGEFCRSAKIDGLLFDRSDVDSFFEALRYALKEEQAIERKIEQALQKGYLWNYSDELLAAGYG